MKKICINDLIRDIEHQLSDLLEDPLTRNQYAWWILEGITGKTKIDLLLQQKINLSEHIKITLQEWICRLCSEHMPLQYILGKVPFLDLEILVEPPILIPRPETEEWVAHLIDRLKIINPISLRIADVGTGSGCIALALAKALPHAFITALDINPRALDLAQRNARHNNITNIEFIQSDLMNNCHTTFDIIVSNPPYITEHEYHTLHPSVALWEDKNALMADDNGLALVKQLIAQVPSKLHFNKQLIAAGIPNILIEIGYKQAQDVVRLMNTIGACSIHVQKDLFGNDRCVQGIVNHVAHTDHKTGTCNSNN
jgi:release factor glutamine methyltransferase